MQQNNRFVLEMDGIDVMLVQEIGLPDVETNVLSYGSFPGNPDKKVSGKKKVGEFTMKKLRPIGIDVSLRTWFQITLDADPFLYKRTIVVREITALNIPVATYVLEDCFPSKISHGGFKRSDDSELVMEEITMQCDDFYQLI